MPEWKAYIRYIIREYRQDEEEDDELKGENYNDEESEYVDKPTPNEFIK